MERRISDDMDRKASISSERGLLNYAWVFKSILRRKFSTEHQRLTGQITSHHIFSEFEEMPQVGHGHIASVHWQSLGAGDKGYFHRRPLSAEDRASSKACNNVDAGVRGCLSRELSDT